MKWYLTVESPLPEIRNPCEYSRLEMKAMQDTKLE